MSTGHVLIVDDNRINRLLLEREVTNQGHAVTMAEDGQQALDFLTDGQHGPFDVVLLDILMPKLDGFQVLEAIKANEDLHHLPVIMISALDELDSVVRTIQMGATDFLTKPFKPDILKARLNASLADKRLRDLELEYLDQVGRVIAAAEAVENSRYDPISLREVAVREDALGGLARVFQRMAEEVHLREQRLKNQLDRLRLDLEEIQNALAEPLHVYLPVDRRFALHEGRDLPEHNEGTALFADISGFTPLTGSLAEDLGPQQGAEEMTRLLNQVYSALIAEVHIYGGVVIGFSGDAITCWFDGDDGQNAITAGLNMQKALAEFDQVTITSTISASLGIKVAVVHGPVRRFLVGDPGIQLMEVITGRTLDDLAAAEHLANQGEVLVQAAIVERAPTRFSSAEERVDPESGQVFHLVTKVNDLVPAKPWPTLPANALIPEQCRPWMPGPVYDWLINGTSQFLADLRPAASLFLKFSGIDYDQDPGAGEKLDRFIQWVQHILHQHEGFQIQLTIGDKGSYLYAAFGTPIAHNDDPLRAVYAALELQSPPPELNFIQDVGIGVTQGAIWSGAYGSSQRRTFGAMGDRVNMAARLMQAARGKILCDEGIYQAVNRRLVLETLPPLLVKGKEEPIAVFSPTGEKIRFSRRETQLIGRGPEQVRLRKAFQELLDGKSGMLLLEGEGGIGKSRLLAEAVQQASRMGIFTLQLVDGKTSLKQLGGGKEITAATESEKALTFFAQSPNDPNDGEEWALADFEALVPRLQELVGVNPVALFIDNGQDLDPAIWEQLVSLASRVKPLLLLLANRPLTDALSRYYAQLQRLPYAQVMTLRALADEAVYLLACAHLGVIGLPKELVKALSQAAGNPYVIEEFIYTLRDEGYILVENGRCRIAPGANLSALLMPATTQGVIISRIDRLSPSEQMVLKVAAVIGMEFSYPLLEKIYPATADKPYLARHLQTLESLELIQHGNQENNYQFRYPIIRETAYNALLFVQRRHLHRQVAEWLEKNQAEGLEPFAATLADHWQGADEPMKAIKYLELAGQHARQKGSLFAAERYLRRSLEIEAHLATLSEDFRD